MFIRCCNLPEFVDGVGPHNFSVLHDISVLSRRPLLEQDYHTPLDNSTDRSNGSYSSAYSSVNKAKSPSVQQKKLTSASITAVNKKVARIHHPTKPWTPNKFLSISGIFRRLSLFQIELEAINMALPDGLLHFHPLVPHPSLKESSLIM